MNKHISGAQPGFERDGVKPEKKGTIYTQQYICFYFYICFNFQQQLIFEHNRFLNQLSASGALICKANQLTGFYMRATVALYGLSIFRE